MFATTNSTTPSCQSDPVRKNIAAAAAAPRNANPPRIRRLLWLRSATAPAIGSTSTCTTVATDSRYPHTEPAGKCSPNNDTSQLCSVSVLPAASTHGRSPLRVKFVFASAAAIPLIESAPNTVVDDE